MTEIFYDTVSDVLYLSFGAPRPAVSQELADDVLVRVDPETERIVGLTILNLSARFGAIGSPQRLPLTFDVQPLG